MGSSRRLRRTSALLALAALLAMGCASGGPRSDPELAEKLERARRARGAASSERPLARSEPTLEAHLRQGDAFRASGEHARALRAYLQAHRLAPGDPRALARVGTLHLAREPERAERIFRDLLRRGDDDALAHTGLGLALLARSEWSAAAEHLRRAVDAAPELAAAHDALGVALERRGEVEAAREAYRRAAALQPDAAEPRNNLGVSYLATGEYQAAAGHLREAGRLAPRDPAVQNNLGIALGRLGRYDAALEAFRTGGDELAAYNNLGYVHFLNGDYEGALRAYERALLAPSGGPERRLDVLRNLRATRHAHQRAGPAPQAH